jgi:outer membrane protein assembly factor BamB
MGIRLGPATAFALIVLSSPATARGDKEWEWPQYSGSPEHVATDVRAAPLKVPKVLWQLSGTMGTPAVRGDRLWVGGEQLFLVDGPTGSIAKAWRPAGTGRFRVGACPVLDGERVIVRTPDAVVAMAADLSKELWRTQTGSSGPAWPSWVPMLAADGAVVFGAENRVTALETQSGAQRWQVLLGAGDEMNMTPTAGDGAVYVGTRQGRLLAIDLRSGKARWDVRPGTEFGSTDPVFVPGRLVIGDRGDREARRPALNAVDPRDGRTLWRTEFGATGLSLPSVDGKRVIAGFARTVGTFDLATGAVLEGPPIRTGPNAFGSPRRIGDALVFGNLDGHLYAHDAESGAMRWALQMTPEKTQVHGFVAAGARWYVATSAGLLALADDPEGALPADRVVRVPY